MVARTRTYAPRRRKRTATPANVQLQEAAEHADRSSEKASGKANGAAEYAPSSVNEPPQPLAGQLQRAAQYGHSLQQISAHSAPQPTGQPSLQASSAAPTGFDRPSNPVPITHPRKKRRHSETDGGLAQRLVQPSGADKGAAIASPAEQTIERSRGKGDALPDDVQSDMGSAFNTDFSCVNVHTDSESNHLNESISSRAFTTGNDIYFRQGEYQPHSKGGQELLAHELTHVVQQSGGGQVNRKPTVQRKGDESATPVMEVSSLPATSAQEGMTVGPAGDRYEQEADSVASEVVQQIHLSDPSQNQTASPSSTHIGRRAIAAKPYTNQAHAPSQRTSASAMQRHPVQCFREVEQGNGKTEVLQDANLDSAEALIADGGKVEAKFSEILNQVAKGSGANVETYEVTKKAKNTDGSEKKTQNGRQIYTTKKEKLTGGAPLKKKDRIDQKVAQKYGGDFGKVLDIVRGTIAYDDCDKLIGGLNFLKELCGAREDLKIVRSKQTFQVEGKKSKAKRPNGNLPPDKYADKLAQANVGPSATAYGDVKVNIAVDSHVCELQFNVVGMLRAKSTKEGHGAYEAMRNLETAWIENYGGKEMPSIDELHALAQAGDPSIQKIEGQLKRAIIASQHAYGGESNEIRKDPKFQEMLLAAESLNA
ncbi:MAG: DUF4157 domain-containing protein [Leptolyngbyaceae bacterium]|nr:DUF4157 domain-containing protein [Leptolyngbyaceae bacterium]